MTTRCQIFCQIDAKLNHRGVDICTLPEIHEPLNEELLNSDLIISSAVNLIPGLKGPSYGGESNTIKKRISDKTATMTRSAMQIPRQLRSLGAMETSS